MQTLIHQNRYSDVSCVYYDVTSENRPICGMTSDLSAHLWDRPICGNRLSCGTQPSCESYIYSRYLKLCYARYDGLSIFQMGQ